MSARAKKKKTNGHDEQYAKLCLKCKEGQTAGYEPKRSVVSGHAVWLHDGVLTCMAWEVREKHWQEDHPA